MRKRGNFREGNRAFARQRLPVESRILYHLNRNCHSPVTLSYSAFTVMPKIKQPFSNTEVLYIFMTVRIVRKTVTASIVENKTNKICLLISVEINTQIHPPMRMYGSKEHTSPTNRVVILATLDTQLHSAVTMTEIPQGKISLNTNRKIDRLGLRNQTYLGPLSISISSS